MPDQTAGMQVYLWTGKGRFKVMDRKEVERQAVAIRMTALNGGKRAAGMNGAGGAAGAASQQDAGTLHDLEHAGGLSWEFAWNMQVGCCGKSDYHVHLLRQYMLGDARRERRRLTQGRPGKDCLEGSRALLLLMC